MLHGAEKPRKGERGEKKKQTNNKGEKQNKKEEGNEKNKQKSMKERREEKKMRKERGYVGIFKTLLPLYSPGGSNLGTLVSQGGEAWQKLG